MSATDRFFDTNILLYLLSADTRKADIAEQLLAEGGTISVQVLNEFTATATRKAGLAWPAVRQWLATIRDVLEIVPLTVEVHEQAIAIAQRAKLHIYDACIVAAAAQAGCKEIITEDLQHGQRLAGARIVNPFK